MMSMGYHAAMLRYSVEPARYPTALLELTRSVAVIREHAGEWNIDADKIVIMGFSAGAHLAASYGVFWKEKFLSENVGTEKEILRPNALLLCYPVISSKDGILHEGSFRNLLGEEFENPEMRAKMSLEDQVNEDTPKCFLWHTYEDDTVPVENSLVFIQALRKRKFLLNFICLKKADMA